MADRAKELAKEFYPDWIITNNPKVDGIEQSEVRIQRAAYIQGYRQAEKELAGEFTAGDRGMVDEIIINLKRIENDYQIDLTREMEWLRGVEKKKCKELALNWQDVRSLCAKSVIVEMDLGREVSDKEHYSEVLRRFNDERKRV